MSLEIKIMDILQGNTQNKEVKDSCSFDVYSQLYTESYSSHICNLKMGDSWNV